ncbi:MAG: putative quorum-sensing-regulated virulence factor [Verrucomicrobiales bacterium]
MNANELPPCDPELWREIEHYHMPFGLFGPQKYPPKGLPLYELPREYVAWFALRGFPKGKLGDLMRLVYAAQSQGFDDIFRVFRQRHGSHLRPPKQKTWQFEEFDAQDLGS